ncbi:MULTISPECIES: SRPBCC family protein [unclassified Fictibacillus]|uniref:SRPBCC family protein n=1 Tax=unclassified Fictibacillus TaxID=2644029 RepID=UPI0007809EA1|nr:MULTISPECIES: carbon monoxide dehydrogenase subunit G [unclassified Fictibacillus]UZJ76850.1 carbon monoxide dehydrogenase subunit G [Fictibacillus sp. KU28468]
MEGKGKLVLDAGVERAYEVLLDPNVLEKCIMGCKKLVLVEDNKYEAELSIGIAAIKGNYSSTIEILDLEEPNHYKLAVKGEGSPGTVEAVGIVDLTPESESSTLLNYSYEAEVGGKVAMVGQRMLGGVAKLVIQDFFKKLGKELKRIEQSA